MYMTSTPILSVYLFICNNHWEANFENGNGNVHHITILSSLYIIDVVTSMSLVLKLKTIFKRKNIQIHVTKIQRIIYLL
jgi:hypothetical protein